MIRTTLLSATRPTVAFIALAGLLSTGCTHFVKPLRQFQGLSEPPTAVAWSADETLLAAGDASGAVCIWEVGSGRAIARTTGYEHAHVPTDLDAIAFAPDGGSIAFGGPGDAVRWWN